MLSITRPAASPPALLLLFSTSVSSRYAPATITFLLWGSLPVICHALRVGSFASALRKRVDAGAACAAVDQVPEANIVHVQPTNPRPICYSDCGDRRFCLRCPGTCRGK